MATHTGSEMKLFTVRFKEALKLRGHDKKSLAELATLFSVGSRTKVHAWLHATRIPSISTAKYLCDILDISFEWLLLGSGTIEGFEMKTADEVVIITKYRNLTKQGKRKLITLLFNECSDHEIESTKDYIKLAEKQATLKLIP